MSARNPSFEAESFHNDPTIKRIRNAVLPVHVNDAVDLPVYEGQRGAAVLMPLIMRSDWQVLLTLRPDYLPRHAGQISFPGGRIDAGECSRDAALRETHEEVGIAPSDIELLGRLPSFDSVSDFRVTPYIGIVNPAAEIIPDPKEVAEAFEIPLTFFMDKTNHKPRTVTHKAQTYELFDMPWKNRNVWGMTAMMLHQLYQRAFDHD